MKTVLLYSIIGVGAVSVGASAGVIYKRAIVEPTDNVVGFDPESCKPDGDALIKKVEKTSPSQAVDKFEPFEIVNYALEKYKRYENSVSYCVGLAKTVIDQYIRSCQVRIGDTFFEEQISKSSMVGVAKRMIQEGFDSDTKVYSETSSNDVTVTDTTAIGKYKKEPQVLTPAQYKEAWGRNLPDMSIYLIAKSTVETQEIVKDGSGYKVTLVLQPVKAGYNYRCQMKTISNLDDYPSYSSLKLTYWLTDKLELNRMEEKSDYSVVMVISAKVSNTLNYFYFPGREYKIPSIDEGFDYDTLIMEAKQNV